MPGSMPIIAGLASDPLEQREIVAAFGAKHNLRLFRTSSNLAPFCNDGQVDAIVLAVHNNMREECQKITEMLANAPRPIVLVARFGLLPNPIYQVALLAGNTADLRVSLREKGPIMPEIANADDYNCQHVSQLLFSLVIPHVPSEAISGLAAAIAVGRHRTTVSQLAAVCRSSVRSLEQTFLKSRLCEVGKLLKWVLATNVAWQVTRSGLRAKQISAHAGFGSAALLDRSLVRSCGRTMSQLRRDGNFEGTLEDFRRIVNERSQVGCER